MYRIFLIAILLLSGTAALSAEHYPGETDAEETALDWLALIDAGSYEESRDQTRCFSNSSVQVSGLKP